MVSREIRSSDQHYLAILSYPHLVLCVLACDNPGEARYDELGFGYVRRYDHLVAGILCYLGETFICCTGHDCQARHVNEEIKCLILGFGVVVAAFRIVRYRARVPCDAREALMLSIFPNLRTSSLNISSPFQYINSVARCVLQRAISTAPFSTNMQRERTCQHAFASVEDVRMETFSSLDYNEALPMNLPSLHRLYTYGLSNSRYDWEPPPESSVQDVELHRCGMIKEELFWMFRSCKAIRTLG